MIVDAAKWAGFLVMFSWMAGCAGAVDGPPPDDEPYAQHSEDADFQPAPDVPGKADSVSASFDQNFIVSDAFFRDGDALDAAQIQGFLDHTPYGRSSWLAVEFVGDRRASAVIADVSRRHDLNPLMLLGRLQVEGSHISKSVRPSQHSVNRALGCGCFDGQACSSAYLGLDKQINCAAETLAGRYQDSVDGSGAWRRGRTRSTSDGLSVTPRNHATAALYAYTPWVLRGRGGNWLVWNITKKYVGHIQDIGYDNFNNSSSEPPSGGNPWVGTACQSDDDCGFSHEGNYGFCYDFPDSAGQTRGFCSLLCNGFCPDNAGHATTFCIASDTAGVGICAAKAEGVNSFCSAIPGTQSAERDRYVGTSDAPAGSATVCAPPL